MKKFDRRSVLTGLGAVGASLWLPPVRRRARSCRRQDQDRAVLQQRRRLAGQARAADGQPVDERRDDRDRGRPRRHRRGRRADVDGRMREHADRPRPVPRRSPLAAHDARLPLSGRTREASFARRARSRALGSQSEGARRARVATPRRQVARPHRALFDGVPAAPGRHDRRCGARLHRRGLPRLPACHGQPAAARSRPLRARAADARGQRTDAQGRR